MEKYKNELFWGYNKELFKILMIRKKSDDNFTLNHNILEEIKLDLLK